MTKMYIVLTCDIPVDRKHGLRSLRYMQVHRGGVRGSVFVISDLDTQVELRPHEFRQVGVEFLTEAEISEAQCKCNGKYELWTLVRK